MPSPPGAAARREACCLLTCQHPPSDDFTHAPRAPMVGKRGSLQDHPKGTWLSTALEGMKADAGRENKNDRWQTYNSYFFVCRTFFLAPSLAWKSSLFTGWAECSQRTYGRCHSEQIATCSGRGEATSTMSPSQRDLLQGPLGARSQQGYRA